MIESDLDGDTIFEHIVSLKKLGINDKCDIVKTSDLKYEDLAGLQNTVSNNLWQKAEEALNIGRKAGLNTEWYSLMMSPKSSYQKYNYGYWLQFYIYRDLLDRAYRKGDMKFINELDKAYYTGDWSSLIIPVKKN
jgi:hypothetical protein